MIFFSIHLCICLQVYTMYMQTHCMKQIKRKIFYKKKLSHNYKRLGVIYLSQNLSAFAYENGFASKNIYFFCISNYLCMLHLNIYRYV